MEEWESQQQLKSFIASDKHQHRPSPGMDAPCDLLLLCLSCPLLTGTERLPPKVSPATGTILFEPLNESYRDGLWLQAHNQSLGLRKRKVSSLLSILVSVKFFVQSEKEQIHVRSCPKQTRSRYSVRGEGWPSCWACRASPRRGGLRGDRGVSEGGVESGKSDRLDSPRQGAAASWLPHMTVVIGSADQADRPQFAGDGRFSVECPFSKTHATRQGKRTCNQKSEGHGTGHAAGWEGSEALTVTRGLLRGGLPVLPGADFRHQIHRPGPRSRRYRSRPGPQA